MYWKVVLVCLQTVYVVIRASQPDGDVLGDALGLEEPPHVLVMKAPPHDLKDTLLSHKQKRLIHNPRFQKVMMDHLRKDIMAHEADYEEESPITRGPRIPNPLPPGFIPPELLAHWGIDWEALGIEDDDDDDDDEEEIQEKIEYLILKSEEKLRGKEGLTMSSHWHPMAVLKEMAQKISEDL